MAPSPSRGRRPHHHGRGPGSGAALGPAAPLAGAAKGVQVLVRVRPMLPRELQHDNAVEVVSDQELVVFKPNAEFASAYDHVLGPHSTQQELYQMVQGSILSAIDGYNATVFAYGQTGTGKTFSMMGPPNTDLGAAAKAVRHDGGSTSAASSLHSATWENLGIIPRALLDLFEHLRVRSERDGVRVSVAASYLEIYNDRLFDLLQPYKKGMGGRDPQDMQQFKALHEVREDKTGATCVPNALCVKVASLEGVLALLHKGAKHRAVRHTEMNMHSSRSHAILQLVVEQFPQGAGGAAQRGMVLRSKLNFVDLAGNERWNKEVDMGADRVGELTSINGSLSALATVVAALTEGAKGKHVPYRDSKLTHLLQDSLGGNCRTTIVATISPSLLAFDETVSTLKFADRASAIGNNPVVNTSRDLGSVLALKEREIARLRQLLAAYMEGGTGSSSGGGQGAGAMPGSALPQLDPQQQQQQQDPGAASSAMESAQQLLAELENTRRALEMERVLRAELEEQLKHVGPAGQPWQQQEQQQQQQGALGHQQQPAASPALVGSQGRPAAVDYLRVVTPTDTSSDFSPSPTTHVATGLVSSAGSGNPFKAVMSRRAELGLAPSLPGDGGSSALGSPARFRDLSPNHHARGGSALSTGGTSLLHKSYAPPSSGSLRQSGQRSDHHSSLEATMRSIREQVMQLTMLEQDNRQRMAAMMSAGRSARVSASPQRNQRRQQPGGPASVYGSPQRRPQAAPGGSAGGGILDSVSHLTPATASHPAPRPLPPHDSFDQLVNAAHASVQQSQQAVAFPVPYGSTGSISAASHSATPELASSGASTTQAWGRSALLRASASTLPSEAGPGSMGAASGLAEARQGTASSSLSAPVMGTTPPGGGWGRSALLAHGASGSGPLVPSHAPPLSAPPANSWGRSAITQQHQPQHSSSSGSPLMLAQQQPYNSAALASKPARNMSARGPGRLDKGSLIYILGSSASSIRAKAMASALQHTAWG